MALTLITAPASEPVSLTEAKAQLRLETDADDTLVTALIQSAKEAAEEITKRQLITATWKLTLDRFPCWTIDIPLPPLQSISSIKYIDSDGVQQTLDAADYIVDTASNPGRLTPAYGHSWPSTQCRMSAVEITFVAGYGDASTDVPQKIRDAMQLYLTWRYEDREGANPMPTAIYQLLTHYIASFYI